MWRRRRAWQEVTPDSTRRRTRHYHPISMLPARGPLPRLSAAVLTAAFLLGACGGNGGGEGAPTTTTESRSPEEGVFAQADVGVVAEDINFPTKEFEAAAGEISIAYRNDGEILHTLVLEDAEGETVDTWEEITLADHGLVEARTITLEPGAFTLFCDVPGHRTQGMEAALAVS